MKRTGVASGLVALLAMSLAASECAGAPQTMTIRSTDNLFGAGHSSPNDRPHPCDDKDPTDPTQGGTVAPMFRFTAGSGQTLTFTKVTGTANLGVFTNGPDGSTIPDVTVTSWNGIAGDTAPIGALAGVFLDDNEPSNAPTSLDFQSTALSTTFKTLSPSLGQIFFIGDGNIGTGSGRNQVFNVPPTATRLFLGIVDGANNSCPGYYYNNDPNSGFTATFMIK